MGAAIQQRWTDERVEKLKGLFEQRDPVLSYSKMAEALGVSRSACIGKVNREGWTRSLDVRKAQKQRRPKPPVREVKRAARIKIHTGGGRAFRGEVEIVQDDVGYDLPPDQSAFAVSLYEVKEHQCRWPLGKPAEMTFCGDEKVFGHSYCQRHLALAYEGVRCGARRAGKGSCVPGLLQKQMTQNGEKNKAA